MSSLSCLGWDIRSGMGQSGSDNRYGISPLGDRTDASEIFSSALGVGQSYCGNRDDRDLVT